MKNDVSQNNELAVYEIEQYEVHLATYRVTSRSVADAIKKVLEVEAELVDGSLQYIDIDTERGLRLDSDPELADELMKLGIGLDADQVPSIHSVCRLASGEGAS